MYAPTLLKQVKWKEDRPNLRINDVVLVMDGGQLDKGQFKLARVVQVFPSNDGKVRKVQLAYKNYKVGERVFEYKGAPDTCIERSVQRLALLAPADQLPYSNDD